MSLSFNVHRGEMLFQAVFSRPAFHLITNLPDLYAVFFNTFSRHGLQLRDMKIEQGAGGLGDLALSFFLMNFTVVVRFRLDRVEVQCFDTVRVSEEHLHEMSVDLLGIFEKNSYGISFQTYSVGVDIHGSVEGETNVGDFLAKYKGSTPENSDPLLASGVVFYYGSAENRLNSSLTVDVSAAFQNALFIRVNSVWDPAKLSIEEFGKRAREHFYQALSSVGLTV